MCVACLYMLIGNRYGLDVNLIDLAGRILIYWQDRTQHDFFIDPLDNGKILSQEDCQAYLASRQLAWTPQCTAPLSSRQTVRRFIEGYDDPHSYSWVMDVDDVLVGTIGAYDFTGNQIEVGFSVVKDWQGRGIATAALRSVLEYLTDNEKIPRVTAWCAAENIGSRRVLEKAGMKHLQTEEKGLVVGDRAYDRMIYEFRKEDR